MSEGADRDDIDAGGGDGGDVLLRDAAGGLGEGASADLLDGGAKLLDGHVVQQDDIGAGGQGLVHLARVADFHFDPHRVGSKGAGAAHGSSDPSGGGDVVLLDEDGIGETEAVVVAAAGADGVLLRVAQAGDGLARVEDARACAGDEVGVGPRDRRRAGERLQEVQRRALARDDAARRPGDLEHLLIGADARAIIEVPGEPNGGVELSKGLIDPRASA